ncbi:hypothetical protein [Novosphingobium sp. AP12]|uniref:hypothetical protein n=1 Tax=Novosphingobium sp. AP12 TaxID=1144305 RepID=UPI000271E6EF|nr:hypothetical protein PMI02_00616 [Novosphingobium sp. AP12]
MRDLYRMNRTSAEVESWFRVAADTGANFATEVYPGYPGLVAEGQGVRAMSWGFPLVIQSKKTGAPLKPKAGQQQA